jgi:hypothetical protein
MHVKFFKAPGLETHLFNNLFELQEEIFTVSLIHEGYGARTREECWNHGGEKKKDVHMQA